MARTKPRKRIVERLNVVDPALASAPLSYLQSYVSPTFAWSSGRAVAWGGPSGDWGGLGNPGV